MTVGSLHAIVDFIAITQRELCSTQDLYLKTNDKELEKSLLEKITKLRTRKIELITELNRGIRNIK